MGRTVSEKKKISKNKKEKISVNIKSTSTYTEASIGLGEILHTRSR